MKVYVTEHEGGRWQAVFTPTTEDQIERALRGVFAFACSAPDACLLVRLVELDLQEPFHSILLPDSQRWDAVNRRWEPVAIGGVPLYRLLESAAWGSGVFLGSLR